jgi:hypothetical protein
MAARRAKTGIACGLALAGTVWLAGCAGAGPGGDRPDSGPLSWLGYLVGEDLRAGCGKGAPERFRMVRAADSRHSMVAIEVTGDKGGGGAVMEARVLEMADPSAIDTDTDRGAGPANQGDPSAHAAVWRDGAARTRLSPAQFHGLVLHLQDRGAFSTAPDAIGLPADGAFWLVNGCHGGRWFFSTLPFTGPHTLDIHQVTPDGR